MDNPWKEDYEVEREEEKSPSGQRYGKAISWKTKGITKTTKAVYLGTEKMPTTKIIVSDDDELIEFLIDRIHELEYKVASLEKQQKETQLNSLIKQNESSRKELEEFFDLDPNATTDTKILDGLISQYADENENSAELVRSVRDNA